MGKGKLIRAAHFKQLKQQAKHERESSKPRFEQDTHYLNPKIKSKQKNSKSPNINDALIYDNVDRFIEGKANSFPEPQSPDQGDDFQVRDPLGLGQSFSDSDNELPEEQEQTEEGKGEEQQESESYLEDQQKKLDHNQSITKHSWGRGKNNYYSADTVDYAIFQGSDDEEIALAEEEESKKIQLELNGLYNQNDFDFGTIGLLIQNKNKNKNQPNNHKNSKNKNKQEIEDSPIVQDNILIENKQTNKNKNKKIMQEPDSATNNNNNNNQLSLLNQMNIDLDNINFSLESENIAVEHINRDLSNFSREEKLSLLLSSNPELFALINDLKDNMGRIQEYINPTIQKLKDLKKQSTPEFTYLSTYLSCLSTYCSHLSFYLYLHSTKNLTKNHPVVEKLVSLKKLIQEFKDLENEMTPSIENLLKGQLNNSKIPKNTKSSPSNRNSQVTKHFSDPKLSKSSNKPSLKPLSPDYYMKLLEDHDSKSEEKAKKVGVDKSNTPDVPISYSNNLEQDSSIVPIKLPSNANKRLKVSFDAFSSFDDFGDLENIQSTQLRTGFKDKPLPGSLALVKKNKSKQFDIDPSNLDAADLEEGLDLYEKLKKPKKKNKRDRDDYEKPQILVPESTDVTQGRRVASKRILTNVGIRRSRPRETKTPRLKNRERFATALKKQHSRVRQYTGSNSNAYGGESTGIKATTIRSTRLY